MSKLDTKLSPFNNDKNSATHKGDSLNQAITSKLNDDESIGKKWQAFIESKIGFVLPSNQRNWFWQAINRLTRETRITQRELLTQAMNDDLLAQKVINAVLIPQSQFFRHPPSFDFIGDCAKQKSKSSNSPLAIQTDLEKPFISNRSFSDKTHGQVDQENFYSNSHSNLESSMFEVWSVGCSFGQEVWSIAMTLENLSVSYQIWGSDVNSSALDWAETGCYDLRQLAEIPNLYRKFVDIDGAYWSVVPKVRQHVEYLYYNLINPTLPHLPLVDIIICQNVLIYFRQFEQRDILARLVQQLKVGGHLILAPEDANQWEHPLMKRLHGLQVNTWVKVK